MSGRPLVTGGALAGVGRSSKSEGNEARFTLCAQAGGLTRRCRGDTRTGRFALSTTLACVRQCGYGDPFLCPGVHRRTGSSYFARVEYRSI